MAIDVASGLFALGGVALAGLFSEFRAAREARLRQRADLLSQRRSVYAEALRRVEAVARCTARWSLSPADDAAPAQAVWDALTAAYETQLEIALIARDPRVAEAMGRVLWAYREKVESDERVLPKPTEARLGMIVAFRRDLGMPAEAS